MQIVVAFKVVADDQDITVQSNRALDYSKARPVVSTFDLNALEAAAQLKDANPGSTLVAITVGDASADDSKLKKNVLARGVDELFVVADDAYASLDAYNTGVALKATLEKIGGYDLIITGDGSADNYAQQVNIQLAEQLGTSTVNAVESIVADGAGIKVERVTELNKEIINLSFPTVVAVSSTIALPRISTMKEILAAGKKPSTTWTSADLGVAVNPTIDILDISAPLDADRKLQIFDASVQGDVDKFIAALKDAIN
jgi:electron transfer flavoprotein beta subunit